MRRFLIIALLATSLNATAETYICASEASAFNSVSITDKTEWVTELFNDDSNIVFEKNAVEGTLKYISGKLLYTCSLIENGRRTYCSNFNSTFALHNDNKRYIMSSVLMFDDFVGSFTKLEYGTCELSKE